MIRKLLPFLALAGLAFAIFMVIRGNTHAPPAAPVAEPSQSPYKTFVAGAGIIEANTENIAIGTPVEGIVTEVAVKVGDHVKAGDALFKLDDRPLQAQLAVRRAALLKAQGDLAKLESMPRPEEIPPLEARVHQSETSLADAKDQLAMVESITDKRAISRDEMDRKRFAVDEAETKLAEAKANLALTKAGAWKPDVEVAKAQVASAQAEVQTTQTDLDRSTVRAPVSGQALQVKVRVGEFAPAGVMAQPMVVLGNVEPMHVRVDVDENDAWRVRAGAQAVGYARGNRDIKTPLKFAHFEPFVIPKKSLTGDSTERVDTRVLQVVYSFDRGDLPLYVGQQMDVFLEAPSALSNVNASQPVRGGQP